MTDFSVNLINMLNIPINSVHTLLKAFSIVRRLFFASDLSLIISGCVSNEIILNQTILFGPFTDFGNIFGLHSGVDRRWKSNEVNNDISKDW